MRRVHGRQGSGQYTLQGRTVHHAFLGIAMKHASLQSHIIDCCRTELTGKHHPHMLMLCTRHVQPMSHVAAHAGHAVLPPSMSWGCLLCVLHPLPPGTCAAAPVWRQDGPSWGCAQTAHEQLHISPPQSTCSTEVHTTAGIIIRPANNVN